MSTTTDLRLSGPWLETLEHDWLDYWLLCGLPPPSVHGRSETIRCNWAIIGQFQYPSQTMFSVPHCLACAYTRNCYPVPHIFTLLHHPTRPDFSSCWCSYWGVTLRFLPNFSMVSQCIVRSEAFRGYSDPQCSRRYKRQTTVPRLISASMTIWSTFLSLPLDYLKCSIEYRWKAFANVYDRMLIYPLKRLVA